jgi:hypothetical protein
MAYRGGGDSIYNFTGSLGVAFADHWTGPYSRLKDTPIFDAEDPTIFRSATGTYHMVVHSFLSDGKDVEAVGTAAFSHDGVDWTLPTPHTGAYGLGIKWANGSSSVAYRRERPKFVFANDGTPLYLLNGVQPCGPSDWGNECHTVNVIVPIVRNDSSSR